MKNPATELTMSQMTAEQAYYQPTVRRRRASRVAVVLALCYFLGGAGAMFAVSIHHGGGTGFGDGRLAASCNTPGGPYYPSDLPAAERTCPQGSVGRTGDDAAGPLENPVKDIALLLLALGVAGAILLAWIWLFSNIGAL